MREFKKGTERYKEAFKGIAVSANPNYRGPEIKKQRTVTPEHREDKRTKSKPTRKSSATPSEVKSAALQLAQEILVPMFETINWEAMGVKKKLSDDLTVVEVTGFIPLFTDVFTISAAKDEREATEIENRKQAMRALSFMREGKATIWTGKRNAKVRLSSYEKFLCDRIEHLLHSLTDLGPGIFDDACTFIEGLPDELMEPELRKTAYNTLKSIKVLLRKASDKGRGAPTGKAYDSGLAVAVAQVAKGFGLRPRRGTELRGEANADRVSACSIVRQKLEELLLNTPGDFIKPLTEAEVEASYGRGKRNPYFWLQFKHGVLRRLGLEPLGVHGKPFYGPWDESLRDLIPFDISEHDLRILKCAVNAETLGVQV